MAYSPKLKLQMIRRMCGPDPIIIEQLARQTGISQTTLSRWRKQATTLESMSTEEPKPVPAQELTWKQKLAIVLEAEDIEPNQLGAFLRTKGLHMAQLQQFRTAARDSFQANPHPPHNKQEQKRIRALERELRRKDKALAEAAALLVLKKKLEGIWEDEDADTPET